MTVKNIVLLGATGSIGENTLRVVRRHHDRVRLVGLAAHSRWRELAAIAREFKVATVTLYDEAAAREARASGEFPSGTRILSGPGGLEEIATLPEAHLVAVAVVGTLGLKPTLAAIRAGKTIALASKEILVMAGKFVMAEAVRAGVALLPMDSEHNAIFQCLHGEPRRHIDKLVLTASGGRFRETPVEELASITAEQALRHPNWTMGPKITVDSSTMANKGLELIEAHWLFDLPEDRIEIVVHPQSIIHSMVRFTDGSLLAHLSPPVMTFAIQHCLFHPERLPAVSPTLDFSRAHRLDLLPPDPVKFPALALARRAIVAGGDAPATYNAANEVAVAAFLQNRIRFTDIPVIIEKTLDAHPAREPDTLEAVLATDEAARHTAASVIASR